MQEAIILKLIIYCAPLVAAFVAVIISLVLIIYPTTITINYLDFL
jgi:hypothetical protein